MDVTATEDGHVRGVSIKDSMLKEHPGIESCIVRVLRGMSLPSSVMAARPARRVSGGMVAPESRTLVGNPAAVAAPVISLSPIILVAAGVTVGVYIFVHVIREATTSTRDETAEESPKERKERCKKVKQECIEKCSDETLPTGTYNGDPFFECRRKCLEAANYWGV